MKSKTIKSINLAGLIGYIISIVLIIASISGMVAVAIGTAGAVAVSGENINAAITTNIDVTSTGNFLEKLRHFGSFDGMEELSSLIEKEGGTVKVDDSELSEVSVSKLENGLSFNAKTNSISFSIKRIIVCLAVSFIFLGAVTVMLYMLKGLMKSIKNCDTPFSDEIIKKMTYFANSTIPVIVLNMICGGLWVSIGKSGFDMTINLSSVFMVMVIYILVTIFKYGAQLQHESDETL
ncbi:MAG: DUF2975 domain-containing protein [Ruminococcaceae bacterium]|nr:DUF2975 domain-containing protein [Oscillospiraceae bacterium]